MCFLSLVVCYIQAMYFHYNLLSRHLTINIPVQDVANALIHKTCEVEHIKIRQIPDRVVIGYVEEINSHPNADALTVCQIDCGFHGIFQILTGWKNINTGMYVAVALPDCYLPEIDLHIVPRKMRWLESNGMICSKEELGIYEDEDKHWIWILKRIVSHHIDPQILSQEWSWDMLDLTSKDIGMWLVQKYPRLNNRILEVDNKTLTHRPDLTWHSGLAQEIATIQHLSSL